MTQEFSVYNYLARGKVLQDVTDVPHVIDDPALVHGPALRRGGGHELQLGLLLLVSGVLDKLLQDVGPAVRPQM